MLPEVIMMDEYMERALRPGLAGRRRALIIEDNDINREILHDLLEDEYDILEAENGLVGLRLLRENSRSLSVILLDVEMPVMDGYEFLSAIRDDATLNRIPVIVTTANGHPEDEIKCLEMGATDFVRKPYNPDVILRRVRSVIRLRESARMLDVLEFDQETGLYTEKAFYQHVESILTRNFDEHYTMIFTNVENMKLINERYTEKTGDQLLRYLADGFRQILGDGLYGRISGDRFGILIDFPEGADIEDLKKKLSSVVEGAPISGTTVKFGIYEDVEHDLTAVQIIDRTRLAVQEIKNQFGVDFAVYDEKMRRKVVRTQQIVENMQQALEEEQFLVYYQPKHSVVSGELCGAEALIRWIHPDFGFMNPGEFIPLFESTGFVTEADRYVWRRTVMNQKKWADMGLRTVPISVNASRLDFGHEDFLEALNAPVAEYGVPRDMLHIEVTETLCSDDSDHLVEVLEESRKAGYQIEMDDFGSGYSSLNTLATLPIDIVKLDMSFMRQIQNPKKRKVLAAAVNLARSLGLKTVAEGVETEEQKEILKELGVDYIQGYYYSKPIPEKEFEEYLKRYTK